MGVQELLIIFAILLLFFGAKKLPGLAGSLGTSIKEFRKASGSPEDDDRDGVTGADTTDGPHPVDRDAER